MTTRIAIQSKGRLKNESLEFLKNLGYEFDFEDRSYKILSKNKNLEIILLRDDDIPKTVEDGMADFGIVGKNEVLETGAKVEIIKELDFGKCRLVLASKENLEIAEMNLKRIATSYPRLTKKFFQEKNVKASIINLAGSVEVAPDLNLAEIICDLTQTGNTLKENNLIELETILESSAVLIRNVDCKKKI